MVERNNNPEMLEICYEFGRIKFGPKFSRIKYFLVKFVSQLLKKAWI